LFFFLFAFQVKIAGTFLLSLVVQHEVKGKFLLSQYFYTGIVKQFRLQELI
jgi:hypothetical protein